MDTEGRSSRVTGNGFRFVNAPFVVYGTKNAMTLAHREWYVKSQHFHALVVYYDNCPTRNFLLT